MGLSVCARQHHADIDARKRKKRSYEFVDELAFISDHTALHADSSHHHAYKSVLDRHLVEEIGQRIGKRHGYRAWYGHGGMRLIEIYDIDTVFER